MNRIFPIQLICLLVLLVLGFPTQAKAREIIIIKSADIVAYNQAVAGIKSAMTSTISVTEYNLQSSLERGRKVARRVRASNAELVFAVGLKAALAAKLEIFDIPVVFCMVLNHEKYDLKAQNMTGIILQVPKARQFKLIRTVLPDVRRLGILYDPEKSEKQAGEVRQQAKAFGFKMVAKQVQGEKEVPAKLREILGIVEALVLIPDSTVLNEDSFRTIMNTALESNKPIIGFSSDLVRSGALLGIFVGYEEIGREAGSLGVKILGKQVKMPRSPIFPSQIKMGLNLKTAKFLGITVPPDVVSSANEIY